MEDCFLWEAPRTGAREEHEEEAAAEMKCCDGFPILLHHSGVGCREMGTEDEPRKKGGVGGSCR